MNRLILFTIQLNNDMFDDGPRFVLDSFYVSQASYDGNPLPPVTEQSEDLHPLSMGVYDEDIRALHMISLRARMNGHRMNGPYRCHLPEGSELSRDQFEQFLNMKLEDGSLQEFLKSNKV